MARFYGPQCILHCSLSLVYLAVFTKWQLVNPEITSRPNLLWFTRHTVKTRISPCQQLTGVASIGVKRMGLLAVINATSSACPPHNTRRRVPVPLFVILLIRNGQEWY